MRGKITADMVKKFRRENGMTKVELARRSGLSRHTISAIEFGDVQMNPDTEEKIFNIICKNRFDEAPPTQNLFRGINTVEDLLKPLSEADLLSLKHKINDILKVRKG